MQRRGFSVSWLSSRRIKQYSISSFGHESGCPKLTLCVREGIALTGAPYTPQTQALVERTNQTLKQLLTKTLITLGIPPEMSTCYRVCLLVNELVHATTGRSPYSLVYGHTVGILPLAMGDVVTVSNHGL
eukprot:GHVR01108453.1.p1 GENE.GHVR01108453.1~~GHVR01108453.1.p1  ORF type:complete len:130 (+),score=4.34 GHVR01108453.1:195-584(+)